MTTTPLQQSMDTLIEHVANRVAERQLQVVVPKLADIEESLRKYSLVTDECRSTMAACRDMFQHICRLLEDRREVNTAPWSEVLHTLHRIADVADRGSRDSRAGFEDLRALAKVYSDRLEAKLQPSDAATGAASNVASEKLIAYLATEYCLGYNPEEVVLKIGKHSASLAELFTEHRVTCGAFITAYNPEGTQQSAEANAQDHAALLQRVVEFGHSFIEGVGAGTTGEWPLERSVFAYGMDKASACAVGRQFHQDAIVWVGADAVPQLVLLR